MKIWISSGVPRTKLMTTAMSAFTGTIFKDRTTVSPVPRASASSMIARASRIFTAAALMRLGRIDNRYASLKPIAVTLSSWKAPIDGALTLVRSGLHRAGRQVALIRNLHFEAEPLFLKSGETPVVAHFTNDGGNRIPQIRVVGPRHPGEVGEPALLRCRRHQLEHVGLLLDQGREAGQRLNHCIDFTVGKRHVTFGKRGKKLELLETRSTRGLQLGVDHAGDRLRRRSELGSNHFAIQVFHLGKLVAFALHGVGHTVGDRHRVSVTLGAFGIDADGGRDEVELTGQHTREDALPRQIKLVELLDAELLHHLGQDVGAVTDDLAVLDEFKGWIGRLSADRQFAGPLDLL